MSVNAALLDNEMSIIRDPDDQTRQMKIGASGQIYVEGSKQLSNLVSNNAAITTSSSGTPYSAGDAIGGLITFEAALDSTVNSGILRSVSVDAKWSATTVLQMWLFNASPTNSTYADNGAFVCHADDAAKKVWAGPLIIACSGGASGIRTVYEVSGIDKPIVTVDGKLYGLLVVESALTTTGTSDIVSVKVGLTKD